MASNKNMSESSKQLNLDMDKIFVPKTISDILTEVSMINDFAVKSSKFDFHINLLKEELRKMESFKRELPHCMQLLQDAIETLRKECLSLRERAEGPVVVTEELIPLGVESSNQVGENEGGESSDQNGDKKSWMSRVRLWTAPVHFHNGNESFPFKSGGAIVPSKKPLSKIAMTNERNKRVVPVEPATSVEEDGGSNHKKPRRCWSPELHNQFVDALRFLGGPYAGTPKQIRELMKVDGLTNDEVKSHLQKYRLHLGKLPNSSSDGITNSRSPEQLLHERGSASRVGADEDIDDPHNS